MSYKNIVLFENIDYTWEQLVLWVQEFEVNIYPATTEEYKIFRREMERYRDSEITLSDLYDKIPPQYLSKTLFLIDVNLSPNHSDDNDETGVTIFNGLANIIKSDDYRMYFTAQDDAYKPCIRKDRELALLKFRKLLKSKAVTQNNLPGIITPIARFKAFLADIFIPKVNILNRYLFDAVFQILYLLSILFPLLIICKSHFENPLSIIETIFLSFIPVIIVSGFYNFYKSKIRQIFNGEPSSDIDIEKSMKIVNISKVLFVSSIISYLLVKIIEIIEFKDETLKQLVLEDGGEENMKIAAVKKFLENNEYQKLAKLQVMECQYTVPFDLLEIGLYLLVIVLLMFYYFKINDQHKSPPSN